MTGYKSALNYNISQSNPEYYLNMGLTAEKLALEYDIKREESDLFSLESHQKAVKAIENKVFDQEIHPIDVEEITVVDGKESLTNGR